MHGRVKIGLDRPKLKLAPSEYFQRNFYITTSGMNWDPTLKFCIEVLGADRIMWAVDYPYQDHPDAVDFLDAAKISERDKQKIYHENAELSFPSSRRKALRSRGRDTFCARSTTACPALQCRAGATSRSPRASRRPIAAQNPRRHVA